MLGALFDAVQGVKRFIFVGDPAQLPPIGAGRPFVNIIPRLRAGGRNGADANEYSEDLMLQCSCNDLTYKIASLQNPAKMPGLTEEHMSYLRLATIFCLLFAFEQVVLAQQNLPPVDPGVDVRIDATAGLFGYFRLPDYQDLHGIEAEETNAARFYCASTKDSASQDAKVFLQKFQAPGDRLLLGTGDNFGPNFGARMFTDDPQTSSRTSFADGHQEKELYYWDWSARQWMYYDGRSWDSNQHQWTASKAPWSVRQGTDTIPTDNVACFLSYAGYAAIVPGKHDFRYGPERLRQLARFLASINQDGFSPVQMLGSNIVIKLGWAKDHKPLALSQKPPLPLQIEGAPPDGLGFDEFTDGGFVYPWLQSIPLVAGAGTTEDALSRDYRFVLCKANNTNPDKFLDTSKHVCLTLVARNMRLESESGTRTADRRDKHPDITASSIDLLPKTHFELDLYPDEHPAEDLEPDASYAVCAEYIGAANSKDQGRFYCTQFSTYIPFFQYGHLGKKPPTCDPDSYFYRKLSNGKEVVVFGVVDPSMAEHVGAGNLQWDLYNEKGHEDKLHTARVTFADPEKALEQTEELFEKEHPHFDGLRVLLAQMEPTAAQAFGARLPRHLRFNIIITEGDDQEATPTEEIDYLQAKDAPTRTLIVVPHRHDRTIRCESRTTPCGDREVHVDEITVKSGGKYVVSEHHEPVRVGNPPDRIKRGNRSFAAMVDAIWQKQFPRVSPTGDASTDFQTIVLNIIRRQEHADAALLQSRDFFVPILNEFLEHYCQSKADLSCEKDIADHFEELMDRILWKGDFIQTISVKGSVLQQVLDQSSKFKQADDSCCQLVDEPARGIVSLGVVKDATSGSYQINGGPLDRNALYTIAVSDYIALGDTGYPELAVPPVGDDTRSPFSHDKSHQLISSWVCKRFAEGLRGNPVLPPISCSANIPPYTKGGLYYDTLENVLPADPRHGLTPNKQLGLWASQGVHSATGPHQPAEQLVEQRRRWEVSTDTLSIGFSGVSHSGNEATLANLFGGVLDPQVNSKRSRSISLGVNSKAARYGRSMDLFVNPIINYQQQTIAQASGTSSETQAFNTVAIEFGTYIHTHQTQSLPNLLWATYGHFETQLANPVTTLRSPSVTFGQGRTNLLLARFGPRWQNRKSFAELGIEGGKTLNAIQSFRILNPTNGSLLLSCAEASTSLQQCITNSGLSIPANSRFVPVRNPLTRTGVYWKLGLVIPVRPSITYTFNESSDFFFNSSGDNSANTRYRHELDQALAFQVANFPALSFQPSLTLFFYENKVAYNTLFQQQYSIKINYSFDWTNTHASKLQFGYKKPPTTQ